MKINSYRKYITFITLMIILVTASNPVQTATAQTLDFPQENAWTRSTPSVVWCNDPSSTTTLEVHIVDREDVARVWLTDLGSSELDARAELFDNGTHGDLQAGDNVFTLGDVVLPCSPDYILTRGGISNWWGMLRLQLDSGEQTGHDYGMVVGLVHQDFKNTFSIHDFGNGLSATAYSFFIQDTYHEVMDDYPVTSVYCGTGNYAAYQKLYSVLPDTFDFALVMAGMQIFRPTDLAENVPYDVLVSNTVQHIGMTQVDKTALFGSAGRLKSTIYHSFGSMAIFDHEVAHTWGSAIGQSLGLVDEQYPVNQGHWNAMADMQGQLGAYYFDPGGEVGHFAYNGDETWHLVSNSDIEPYSPLELYIMGLIPSGEVPPIHLLQSPNTGDLNRITAASYRTVTIADILQAEGGERIPSAVESQKDFNLAFIVTQDVPYNDAAYAYFSLLAYSLETREPPWENSSLAPFYWATGGRATLTSRLPVSVPDPVGLPGIPGDITAPDATPSDTTVPSADVPTTVPGAGSTPVTTPTTTGWPPICGSIFGTIGLALLPGVWRLLKKRLY